MTSSNRSLAKARWVAACAALFGTLAGVSARAVTIPFPFTADFEPESGYSPGSLHSDAIWSISSALNVKISTQFAEGSQSLSFKGDAWLLLAPDAASVSGGYPVTWVDYYVRPVYRPLADIADWSDSSQTSTVGFILRTANQGEVFARDGEDANAWTSSGKIVALDSDLPLSWQRLSYRIDYQAKRWDLYIDGALALTDLKFSNEAAGFFTRFGLPGHHAKFSFLDFFYLGGVNPLFPDADNDGLPDAWTTVHGLSGPNASRRADPDLDGVDNLAEYRLGLNPSDPDTDHDNLFDGSEIFRGTDPLAADNRAFSAFPFSDGFESDIPGALAPGTRAWSVSLSDVASFVNVVAAPTTGGEGAQSLALGGGASLAREFVRDPSASSVWLDFRAQLSPRDQPPLLSKDIGALFYLAASGELMVLDGSGAQGGAWSEAGVIPAGWHRYTIRLDYTTQRWALWVDNVRVRTDLGFASHVPYFAAFHFGETSIPLAGLDAIAAGIAEPAGLDNDGDGIINSEERVLGSNPDLKDTDGDGLLDPTERAIGTSLTNPNGVAARLVRDSSGNYVWQTQFASAEGYANGFLSGQGGWVVSGDATISDGSIHLSASTLDVRIEKFFVPESVSHLWVRFRAKMAPGTLPSPADVGAPLTGMFGYLEPSTLAVYDGAQADWTSHAISANAREWNDYVFSFDYTTRRWLIAVNGRLVARDIQFHGSGLDQLTRLRVLQQGDTEANSAKTAAIDDVIVSSVAFADLDLDQDGLLDSLEASIGTDPFAPDTDGDTLPDQWEHGKGLNPLVESDATADPDADGFINLLEYQLGLEPLTADLAATGLLVNERWDSLTGSSIADLTNNSRFASQPSSRTLLSSTDLPKSAGDNYANRVRGYLRPSVTGDYLFWVAGDDATELWVSPTASPFDRVRVASIATNSKYQSYDENPSQKSGQIRLEAGRTYYFELLHKEGIVGDFASIAWTPPGGARSLIPPANFSQFAPLPADADGDGLPDAWESARGLDATKAYAFDGAYRDKDGDGLTNLEEYQYGTNPSNAFTFGGGVGDREAVFEAGLGASSGPIFTTPPVVVGNVAPQSATPLTGSWLAGEAGLDARSLRGSFSVGLTVPADGLYRLDLTAMDVFASNPSRVFELELAIDGRSLGRLFIKASGSTSGLGRLYLPWLSAGAHQLTVTWHNGRPDSFLRVVSIALVNPSVGDTDANGVYDWVSARLNQTFGLDPAPVETHVSPYTAEGRSAYPAFLSASSVTLGATASVPASLTVQEGLTRHFFVHVPLDSEGATRLTVREAGGLRQVSKDVTWTPLNLLAAPPATPLLVRLNDRLLVSAVDVALDPEAEVAVLLVKPGAPQETFSLVADDTVEIPFPAAGDYELWVARPGEAPVLALVVKARGVSFAPLPLFMETALREWHPAGLPSEAVLERDSGVYLEEMLPATSPRTFKVGVPAPLGGRMVARLGANGPIAAAAGMVPVRNYHAETSTWDVVQVFSDGTEMWQVLIDLGGPVPPNLVIRIDVIKSGVTFADGTLTRTLTAADFDANGRYIYYMLRSADGWASVCHEVRFYDGGTYLNYSH